jgi:hypothetical protein
VHVDHQYIAISASWTLTTPVSWDEVTQIGGYSIVNITISKASWENWEEVSPCLHVSRQTLHLKEGREGDTAGAVEGPVRKAPRTGKSGRDRQEDLGSQNDMASHPVGGSHRCPH